MDSIQMETIAYNYSKETDFDKIRVKWNGKYGKDFHDSNEDFRIQLCEFIYPQLDKVNINLIRDLYMEFAKTSEATFGAYLKLNILGQELLNRGRTTYLMDYLEGASYTMDTYMVTGRIQISKDLAKQILLFINDKLKTTDNEKERKLLELCKQRFEWLSK